MSLDYEPRLLPTVGTAQAIATDDRAKIIKEVEAGLPSSGHRRRLADAIENQAFYDLDGERYAQRREAETEFDFAGRPHRVSGFVQQVVDRLCQHSYNPGPTRSVVGDAIAESVLRETWESNHIDLVLEHAEAMATLNDVAAIEVTCDNDPEKPVGLRLWGADEFTVFVHPDDPLRLSAMVAIDRYNGQTRYRLWFDDEVHTFLTSQWSPEKTAGARAATRQGPPEPNTYGCIPFSFVHYRAPVRNFWTPGPGTFLRQTELRLNDRLSQLDELIQKYARPLGYFRNVGPTFTPEIGPGRFMRLNRGGTGYTGEGYADGGEPEAGYLQAEIAIEAIWLDLQNYTRQVCTAVDLPYTSLELDYQDATSGIALVIKEAPLLGRARRRRRILQLAESRLAKVILTASGNHYGQPELVDAARTLRLLLAWPEPRIPVPDPQRDQLDEWEMQLGIKSRVTVLMERYSLTREQAIDHLRQVAEDEEEARQANPDIEDPMMETEGSEGNEEHGPLDSGGDAASE